MSVASPITWKLARASRCAASALLVLVLPLGACSGKPEVSVRRVRTTELPQRVNVPASKIVVGVQTGTIRFERVVGGFSITRAPITVAQYEKCVEAGVCGKPALRNGACSSSASGTDGYTYDADPAVPDAPVTCVSVEQAQGFCDWAGGGRLPTSEEWALAARGPSVARYAWGKGSPTCEHHFRVGYGPAEGTCCEAECASKPAAVGQRAKNVSPFDLTDVLLTRGELIGAYAGSGWPGCQAPYAGCVVHGRDPGAIDAFTATGTPTKPEADVSAFAAAFRCVWEGEK